MRYIWIFTCFLILACSSKEKVVNNNLSFLQELKTQSKQTECGLYTDDFYENKKEIIKRLDSLMYKNHPIFLIQEYNHQSGEFYEAIWNKKSPKIEYKKDSRGINLVNNLYPNYYYELIESWDTEKIKEYENKYGNNFGANPITGIKVEMNRGELKISCINFSSFYLLDTED